MSIAQEVANLSVRLSGDGRNYSNMLRNAQIETKTYTDSMGRLHDAATGKFVGSQNRMGMALQRTARQTQTTTQRLQRMGEVCGTLSGRLRRVGMSASMYLTTPLTMVGGLAVKAYSDFNRAMIESTSIMTVTNAQTKEMEAEAKRLASILPIGPTELAKSYYFLASAGLSATESIKALPKVANFAIAGAFDMATATDLLTDAQTALGWEMDANQANMELLGDHMVLAAKQANASVQQFAESLTADAGVAARNFGMDVTTLMAVLGAYASAGKKGAEAGNLMGRATRLLTKAFREHAEVFNEYHIKVVSDTTGEYRNFIGIIEDLEKAFKGLTAPEMGAALSKLGFEALAQKSILPLIGMSSAMKEWEKAQADAAGTTKNVAQKQLESFANQMKITWNQIKLGAMELGEALAPMILYVGTLIKGLVVIWRSWPPWLKVTVAAVGALIAILGPLLMIFSVFLSMVPLIVTGFTMVWAAITGPAGIVIGIIGAIVAGLAGLLTYMGMAEGRKQAKKDDTVIAAEKEAKRIQQVAKDVEKAIEDQEKAVKSQNEEMEKAGVTINKTTEALKEYNKTVDEGKRVMEEYATPQEKYIKRVQDLHRLLKASAISHNVFMRAINAAKKELADLQKKAVIDITVKKGFDAALKGSAEATEIIDNYQALKKDLIFNNGELQAKTTTLGPEAALGGIASGILQLVEVNKEQLAEAKKDKKPDLESAEL